MYFVFPPTTTMFTVQPGAPFFIADDGDIEGEFYEEEPVMEETSTPTKLKVKNPFENMNVKNPFANAKNPFAGATASSSPTGKISTPKVDTTKVKDWVSDFANSKEGEAALDGLKGFAGIVADVGKELAKGVGKTVGDQLKELKESKKNKDTTATTTTTPTTAKATTFTPPPAAPAAPASYLENLESLEESEEYEYYDDEDLEDGFAP